MLLIQLLICKIANIFMQGTYYKTNESWMNAKWCNGYYYHVTLFVIKKIFITTPFVGSWLSIRTGAQCCIYYNFHRNELAFIQFAGLPVFVDLAALNKCIPEEGWLVVLRFHSVCYIIRLISIRFSNWFLFHPFYFNCYF